jgi:hypothetical protein
MNDNILSISLAIDAGDNSAAKAAILASPDLLKKTWMGDSLLHGSARDGNLEMTLFLLEQSMDVNISKTGAGYETPLSSAALGGHVELARLLLERGAFVDGVDATSHTPLMLAARSGNAVLVRMLLEAGADVNRLGAFQRLYPLDFAGWQEDSMDWKVNEDVIGMLKERGAFSITMQPTSWQESAAWPIMLHVNNHAGPLFPKPFLRTVADEEFAFWLADVKDKIRPLFLFSAGAYEYAQQHGHGMVELGFVLTQQWSVLSHYRNPKSRLSFPLDMLQRLVALMQEGEEIITGYTVSRVDERFSDLGWPEGIDWLVAVDHDWELARNRKLAVEWKGKIRPRETFEDDVDILTLAPVTTKNFVPTEKNIQKFLTDRRGATWKKMLLPDSIYGDKYL